MTTVSSDKINSLIWKNFRDLIKNNVVSVTIQGSTGADTKTVLIQDVLNSYPDKDKSTSSDYPIIIINSPTKRTSSLTYRNKIVPGSIEVEVFATQKEAIDKIMDKINDVILDNETTLNTAGIQELNIIDEDSSTDILNGIKGHRGLVVWGFEYEI